MEKKTYQGAVEIKEDGEAGEFRAIFSTLNVVDADGDVTPPGAFENGQKVRIAYWGHRWQDLPVGRGVIHADDERAWIDGRFFVDTEAGRETYLTVKNLGELQEWSYGFDIDEEHLGQFDGQDVRFLDRMTVHEVSPVMLGAGVGTHTENIKEAGLKPYPNEHACRLRSPDDFQEDSFRRADREHDSKKYSVIMGRLKGEDALTEQAYRYPKDIWTVDVAKEHCDDHDGTFEAASEKAVSDGAEGGEGEAGDGDGKPSGRSPRDVQVQIDILKVELLQEVQGE